MIRTGEPQVFRGLLFAFAAALLAGCASTAEVDTGPYGHGVSQGKGPDSTPLPVQDAYKFQADLNRRLQDALLKDPETALVLPMPRADGLTALGISEDAFKPDSGELLPEAMSAMDQFAQILKTSGACVVHVLGERAPGAAPADSSDLGQRRGAAIAAVLAQLGVPQDHIRSESRVQPGSDGGGVIIIVRPLLSGHEQDAWKTPPVEG